MAIYDEEYEYEDNSVLDNMIEACSNMIDMIDEGARTKYVEMKAKEAKDYKDKADSMPDKETKTVDKNFKLPFGYSLKGSKTETIDNRNEKRNLYDKGSDAEEAAAKYSGNYYKKGKDDIYMTYGKDSVNSIHNAGKPHNRYDSGAHGTTWRDRSKKVDYEAMARSKAGKDAFNKDFGGPSGIDRMTIKIPGNAVYNKQIIKNHLKAQEIKKNAVKEACLYILSRLDDIE